jgi:hypothetical protein
MVATVELSFRLEGLLKLLASSINCGIMTFRLLQKTAIAVDLLESLKS